MRITIETTASEPQYSHKAIVEVPMDEQDIYEMGELIKYALRGMSFSDEVISKLFGEAKQ